MFKLQTIYIIIVIKNDFKNTKKYAKVMCFRGTYTHRFNTKQFFLLNSLGYQSSITTNKINDNDDTYQIITIFRLTVVLSNYAYEKSESPIN